MKLKALKLNVPEMKAVTGGSESACPGWDWQSDAPYTCWCTFRNIGGGYGHIDCADRCREFCNACPALCNDI